MSNLHVTNQAMTTSLHTSWTRATGDIDSYQIHLIHENIVIKNESVSSETNQYVFHSLKPGGLYSVVVTTISGGIPSRQSLAEERTGKNSVGQWKNIKPFPALASLLNWLHNVELRYMDGELYSFYKTIQIYKVE